MATYTAATVSLGDVQVVLTGGKDSQGNTFPGVAEGDTVILPPGTASYTSTLTVSKSINLIGVTTTDTSFSGGSANDQTIILDDVPRVNGVAILLNFAPPVTGLPRLSGITFRNGSGTTKQNSGSGLIRFTTLNHSIRVDHCHFDQLYGQVVPQGDPQGVIDHCIFDAKGVGAEFLIPWNNQYGGQSNGDGSWTDPNKFATNNNQFLFAENNCFNNLIPNSTPVVGSVDAWNGSRMWIRNNFFRDCHYGNHDLGPSSRQRGARCQVVENNNFDYVTVVGNAGVPRAGSSIYHDNTWSGSMSPKSGPVLTIYREQNPYQIWGGATGGNPWDLNDITDHTGNGFGGGPNGLFASGTCSSGTNSKTLTVVATWTPSQWIGYEITNLDQPNGGQTYTNSNITANTSNTINTNSAGALLWNTGNRYEIRLPIAAMDQAGRGQGDLVTGQTPLNNGIVAWPHQALEPVYNWHSKHVDNTQLNAGSGMPSEIQNRDYFNENTTWVPGNPVLTGIAVGTHAQRLVVNGANNLSGVASDPGTGFWETDTNSLYVWKSGAWTLWFQSFTYPHPLAGMPTFNSPTTVTYPPVTASTFTVSASPNPTITQSGTLPAGMTFTGGVSTASLHLDGSTPTGKYPTKFTATNASGSTDQNFVAWVSSLNFSLDAGGGKNTGAGGTATGGDVNLTGNANSGATGGAGANGGAGGATGIAGTPPGGGGGATASGGRGQVRFSWFATPYTPVNDPNVLQWFKADALSLSDGSAVANWPASTGLNATQSDPSLQPTFKTNILNGLPVVRSDGTSFLGTVNYVTPIAQPFQIFIVFKIYSTTGVNASIFACSPGVNLTLDPVDPFYAHELTFSSNIVQVVSVANTNWNILGLKANGSSSGKAFNGANFTAFSGSPGTSSINNFGLFSAQTTPQIDIGEVIVLTGNPNPQFIWSYLNGKWAVY